MYELNGKKILVIGAAGGIGAACAELLADGNAQVIASGRTPNPEAKKDISLGFLDKVTAYYPCDVTNSNEIDELFKVVKEKMGTLDGFVYCSGIGSSYGFLETSLEHFDRVISINLRGAFYASQKAAELMNNGGSIVLIASQKGLCGSTGSLAYNASKGGMVIMARSMALELGNKGIRVNCVCPGPTETPMFRDDMNNQPNPDAARAKVAASNPLNRITEPNVIAEGVRYVLSDASSFMTGTELVLDGGNIAGVRNI